MSTTSGPSPLPSNRSPIPLNRDIDRVDSKTTVNLDLSLPTALSHLVLHLIQPLSAYYPHSILLSLRDELISKLTDIFSPSWEGPRPQLGSGYRSLICTKHIGLPKVLCQAADKIGVDVSKWRKSIASLKSGERGEEWQCWCDPGQVTWRWGGWEWEDHGYEPTKVHKEPLQIIWQSSSSLSPSISTAIPNAAIHTPSRPSYAIPIRAPTAGPPTPGPAPTLFAIPPTPAQNSSETILDNDDNLLPAFSTLGLGHPSGHGGRGQTPSGWTSSTGSRETSYGDSFHSESDNHSDSEGEGHDQDRSKAPSRGSHRGSESTSSITSSVSDSNSGHTQLLTPASRPGSADPFSIPTLSLKDKDRSRKITPPNLNNLTTRGRTPSPNTSGNETTPGTENTVTPSQTQIPTPTVTPYDGGNVTVLGGGVKLGGSSRPSSVLSHRSPMDRSRSPSISLASRALNTATAPGTDGMIPRKQRTRRRIMPTYLGHLGQPGVGGPVMGAFQFTGPTATPSGKSNGASVGVGVSPPPITSGRSVSLPTTMPRMG
ncbi:uncharacterized protein IL334_005994 [Kwoniella shivajii]|uniref:Anti-proliferative protein domain-containing protein n=1 Tax=Kwoniella shivajii TaxID=564305 RepID=A0ABZ1D8P3_9TREE|nr:hypothetical protein IL334_005994 [Kwoniella shivajii]